MRVHALGLTFLSYSNGREQVLARVCWVLMCLCSRSSRKQRLRGDILSKLRPHLLRPPTSAQELGSQVLLFRLRMSTQFMRETERQVFACLTVAQQSALV